MSYDIFVLIPKLESKLAEQFNQYAPQRGLNYQFQLASCNLEPNAVWELMDGEEPMLELYPRLSTRAGIAGIQHELHAPCREPETVLMIAALLAEIAGGYVSDPQAAGEAIAVPMSAEHEALARRGIFTPALARELAKQM